MRVCVIFVRECLRVATVCQLSVHYLIIVTLKKTFVYRGLSVLIDFEFISWLFAELSFGSG